MFSQMESAGTHRCLLFNDPPTGLRAVLALDSFDLGPAVGGVRTKRYRNDVAAVSDAARLARAMSLKCAIAGLNAGGGKTVVIDHGGLDRPKAFRLLGRYVEDLGGLYRCAGDLGTTQQDLLHMAETTQYVETREPILREAVAAGVLNCMRACAAFKGRPGLDGVRVLVQGCGSMGSAVARELVAAGATVFLSDTDAAKVQQLAADLQVAVVAPDEVFVQDVDLIAPCAVGGVITEEVARDVTAWGICGAANNQIESPAAEQALLARGVLYVPDFLSSAGGVIAGMTSGSNETHLLIKGLEQTATHVLRLSSDRNTTTTAVAEKIALERIVEARRLRQALES